MVEAEWRVELYRFLEPLLARLGHKATVRSSRAAGAGYNEERTGRKLRLAI
jgi:hypothetical protein